jgi:5-methyltetrahydropteroyltriglutamate--homocysteine methyltransferase
VVGPIRRTSAVLVRDLKVLRANTDRPVKMTIPGPFTMSKQAQDDYYRDPQAVALGFAAAVNSEIRDLFAAGADIVQIDEPWMQQHPDDARRYGLAALNRALDGVTGTVAVHLCFGYAALVHGKPAGYSFLPELENSKAAQISIEAAQPRLDLKILETLPTKTIVLGVNDLADENAETPELVAARIRAALAYVPAERLAVAPDCGMKYLPREIAFAKMKALADGAAMVRREIGGG